MGGGHLDPIALHHLCRLHPTGVQHLEAGGGQPHKARPADGRAACWPGRYRGNAAAAGHCPAAAPRPACWVRVWGVPVTVSSRARRSAIQFQPVRAWASSIRQADQPSACLQSGHRVGPRPCACQAVSSGRGTPESVRGSPAWSSHLQPFHQLRIGPQGGDLQSVAGLATLVVREVIHRPPAG